MAATDDVDEQPDDDDDIPQGIIPGSGPGREEMTNNFMPGETEYSSKTVLAVNDPARIAALRNWDKIFPSRAHQQPLIDGYTTEFVKARPSVGGKAWDTFKDIIMSLWPGSASNDDSDSNAVRLVAGDIDDD